MYPCSRFIIHPSFLQRRELPTIIRIQGTLLEYVRCFFRTCISSCIGRTVTEKILEIYIIVYFQIMFADMSGTTAAVTNPG